MALALAKDHGESYSRWCFYYVQIYKKYHQTVLEYAGEPCHPEKSIPTILQIELNNHIQYIYAPHINTNQYKSNRDTKKDTTEITINSYSKRINTIHELTISHIIHVWYISLHDWVIFRVNCW